jgi:hypothetical protein
MTWNKSETPSVRLPGSDFFNNAALKLEEQTDVKMPVDRLKRLATYTAIFGIVHALLYISAFYFFQEIPLGNATDADILAFYGSGGQSNLVLVGMYLLPFSGIAFIYFMVLLRSLVTSTGQSISSIFSNIQFLAGAVFIALLFTAGAASASTAASLQFAQVDVDPMFARQLPLFSSTLLVGFAMRMTAMFVFTSSSMGLAASLVPSWFAYLGYLVGIFLLLSASFASWFVLVFPVWVIMLCVIVWMSASRLKA